MQEIITRQINHNISTRTASISYIVIHDTGNVSKGSDAVSHFNYFSGGNRNSSADFFVDDKSIWQINDYTRHYTWHCGDGSGRYGITNGNSIGIEICINSDGNYEAAFNNAVQLTRKLMRELNIPIDRVVRHYDASRKNCPATMNKDGNWSDWKRFLSLLLSKELTKPDEIAWEYGHRGIVTDVDGFLAEMEQNMDARLYWLARKTLQYMRSKDV